MAYLVTQPCALNEWPNISGSRAEGDIWGHDVTDIVVLRSGRPSSTSSRRGA